MSEVAAFCASTLVQIPQQLRYNRADAFIGLLCILASAEKSGCCSHSVPVAAAAAAGRLPATDQTASVTRRKRVDTRFRIRAGLVSFTTWHLYRTDCMLMSLSKFVFSAQTMRGLHGKNRTTSNEYRDEANEKLTSFFFPAGAFVRTKLAPQLTIGNDHVLYFRLFHFGVCIIRCFIRRRFFVCESYEFYSFI